MKKNRLKWIFKRTKGAYKYLIFLAVSSVLISVSNVLFAIVLKEFVDNAINGSIERIFQLIIASAVIVILEGYFICFNIIFNEKYPGKNRIQLS